MPASASYSIQRKRHAAQTSRQARRATCIVMGPVADAVRRNPRKPTRVLRGCTSTALVEIERPCQSRQSPEWIVILLISDARTNGSTPRPIFGVCRVSGIAFPGSYAYRNSFVAVAPASSYRLWLSANCLKTARASTPVGRIQDKWKFDDEPLYTARTPDFCRGIGRNPCRPRAAVLGRVQAGPVAYR